MEFQEFVQDYYARFAEALTSFDKGPMTDVLRVVDQVIENDGYLWVAGNGGSAGISNHTCCDMTKGTHVVGKDIMRCQSFVSNMPLLTAIANDMSYDEVFEKQVEYYMKKGDALLVVSSSGNSPNVVNAVEKANALGHPTVAFVGFKGGKLKEIAGTCVWIPIENYGIVEDAHQSLIHCISQYMRKRATSD